MTQPDGAGAKASAPPDTIDFVVVERTVKVTSWIPKATYLRDGNQMTDQEILDYERDMPDEDAFQMLVEAVEVSEPHRIEQTCRIDFTVGTADKSTI